MMEFGLSLLFTVLTLSCVSKQMWFRFTFEVLTNKHQCVFSAVCLLIRVTAGLRGTALTWRTQGPGSISSTTKVKYNK